MGSIVPGAGAVPGAGSEDPGEGRRGEEEREAGIWGYRMWGAKERIQGTENGLGTVGQVEGWGEEGGVDGVGSRSQSLKERAEGHPERKDGKGGGEGESRVK